MDWPNLHKFPKDKNTKGCYWTFSTFFDSCKVPQLLMAIEMIEKGKVNKTYRDVFYDLMTSVQR